MTPGLLSLFPADRLAVSSWCWASDYYAGRFSLLDLPARAAATGFSRVEANDFMLPPPRCSRIIRPLAGLIPGGHADLWRYRLATIRQFKKNLQRAGVTCLSWTLNTDFSQSGPGRRLYRRWGLMAAAAVSARVVRITAGSAGIPVQTNAAKMLPFVVSALKSYPQITIVLENHGGISSDIENHVKIFKRVHTALAGADRDRFSLCLDPTNVPKGDPIPHWQRMAPFTAHVHLKAAREDQPIDLKRLNSIIDKSHQDGFEGWYVVEDLALLGTG